MPQSSRFEFERTELRRPARAEDYGAWLAGAKRWQVFFTGTTRDLTFTRRGETGFTAPGTGTVERMIKRYWRDSIRTRSHTAAGAFAFEYKRESRGVTPHVHGVISGLPWDVMRDLALSRINHSASARDGSDYLWREWYQERFGGHARVDVIEDVARVSGYVAKYITKDLGKMYLLGDW